MAVDYREDNMQLESTANQLPHQPSLFQQLFAKVDNLWGYHLFRLSEDSSKVTAIITPRGVYRFLACPFLYWDGGDVEGSLDILDRVLSQMTKCK